ILTSEPVGFLHPFQVDDVVQRGQSHPSFRSCQFSYPLPFRGQVCETQSSLPCFPSTVLPSRRLPSLDRVPASPVPRRHRYFEGATTSRSRIPGHLFASLPGPTRFPRSSCSLCSAPARMEVPHRAGILVKPVIPLIRLAHRVDVSGISQVPRRPVLCLCPVPRPRPIRRSLTTSGPVGAAP